MATQERLEHLYAITDNTYTTASESLDGLLIGLATWLIIRNSEFIILDILTFLFGDRNHRVAYRVLRIWEVLNLFHFHTLFTGFDSDIPRARFRTPSNKTRHRKVAPVRLTTTKGTFRWLLVFSVLLAKLLVFGAEVAIIAFVIPVQNVHTSNGGLGFRWKNTTVTQQSIEDLPMCQHLIASDILADTAQLVLCKRIEIAAVSTPLPPKWIPDATLRLEEVSLTPENIARLSPESVDKPEDEPITCKGFMLPQAALSVRMNASNVNRQTRIDEDYSVRWDNTITTGEVLVTGLTAKTEEGFFMAGTAALLPLFSDVRITLRLAFPEFWGSPQKGGKAVTLNGHLLFGGPVGLLTGKQSMTVCTDAIDEFMRITGTLDPGLLLDVIRSGMTVYVSDNFTQPSVDLSSLQTDRGFEIGKLRKFRIQPEWMGLAALVILLLSAITSRLNQTRARMARVYREHNNMWSACSASFLEKEVVVEDALFQNEDQFHWGSDPGWPWHQVPLSELYAHATLV